jgi:uncharacterized protein YcbX
VVSGWRSKRCGWEAKMEWEGESKRDAVTRGDSVFILVCQQPTDLGRGCKGDGISIQSRGGMICMIKRSWTRLNVGNVRLEGSKWIPRAGHTQYSRNITQANPNGKA